MTPLYPQKLALTSPTGGGHSVGIVRVRTKATEFSFFFAVSYKVTPSTSVTNENENGQQLLAQTPKEYLIKIKSVLPKMKNMGMTCRQEVLYRNVRIIDRRAQIQQEFEETYCDTFQSVYIYIYI